MRRRIALAGVVCGMSAAAWASEPSCYVSAADAVAQVGARGVVGYRVETVRRDVFSGAVWATLRNCGHPERPSLLVLASVGKEFSPGLASLAEHAAERVIVMNAGSRVRLIEAGANVQLEVSAIAQGNAAVGERVRVRLVPVSAENGSGAGTNWAGNDQFAMGVVRSRGVVEMETR